MTTKELIKLCETFEVEKSDFAAIILNGRDVLGNLQREFAATFGVNESTISRWAKGLNRPVAGYQNQVVKMILKKARRKAVDEIEQVEIDVAPSSEVPSIKRRIASASRI